jgi:hypothetical protein
MAAGTWVTHRAIAAATSAADNAIWITIQPIARIRVPLSLPPLGAADRRPRA